MKNLFPKKLLKKLDMKMGKKTRGGEVRNIWRGKLSKLEQGFKVRGWNAIKLGAITILGHQMLNGGEGIFKVVKLDEISQSDSANQSNRIINSKIVNSDSVSSISNTNKAKYLYPGYGSRLFAYLIDISFINLIVYFGKLLASHFFPNHSILISYWSYIIHTFIFSFRFLFFYLFYFLFFFIFYCYLFLIECYLFLFYLFVFIYF